MYGEGNVVLGLGAFMGGITNDDHSVMADFFFQVVFVATAASIVSGAVAERMKYWAFMILTLVLTTLIALSLRSTLLTEALVPVRGDMLDLAAHGLAVASSVVTGFLGHRYLSFGYQRNLQHSGTDG